MRTMLAFLCIACGCSSLPKYRPAAAPKSLISLGMDANAAMEAMTQAGYSCELVSDSSFRYQARDDEGHWQRHDREGIDFVECHHSHQSGIWVTWIDTVALVLDDDRRVTEILKRGEGIGP